MVGAGVAGVAAALRLHDLVPQAQLVLVDQADRVGGKVCTGELAGEAVEAGAETFLVREYGAPSAVSRLVERVGLGPDLVHPAAVPAAIALDGQLHLVPAGTLLGVPSDLSTVAPLATVDDRDRDDGQPLLQPGQDVSVGTLVRARLGDEVVDRLVDPMLGGVYAGRADRLSLATTMPGLFEAAQHHPTLTGAVRAALAAAPRPPGAPVFGGVRGGLSRLVDAAVTASTANVRRRATVRRLSSTGDGWRLLVGSAAHAEELRADAVVLAVPGRPAGRLLACADISALEYASVALVTLALAPGTPLPALSGFLVPATEGFAVKAATFLTAKWPWMARPGVPVVLRASVGRQGDEAVLRRTDPELVTLVRGELATLLGAALPAPLGARVTRWGGALPQYPVGHQERIARVRAGLPPTLALAGAAYDGVGIAACVRSGEAAADSVRLSLGE